MSRVVLKRPEQTRTAFRSPKKGPEQRHRNSVPIPFEHCYYLTCYQPAHQTRTVGLVQNYSHQTETTSKSNLYNDSLYSYVTREAWNEPISCGNPKTLERKMPIVTESWWTVPKAPRYLCGVVSDSTIGATQFTRPTQHSLLSAQSHYTTL